MTTRRPPFPEALLASGTARVYLRREPAEYKRGKIIPGHDVYGQRKVLGARVDGEVHCWRASMLKELWAVLPWQNGRIEWAYDPDHRALVVRWENPQRRGQLRLYKAVIT